MGTFQTTERYHRFDPEEDLLVIEVIDPGTAGEALEIELVLTPFQHADGVGTVVGYRALGPGLDPAETRVLTRCIGIAPDEWSEANITLKQPEPVPPTSDWLWRFSTLPSRLTPGGGSRSVS